jgi:hypothetical protein
MITPGKLDLIAYRWTPFVYVIDFEGLDFSAATFAMDVRLYRDAPSAVLSLGNAASNAQGISCSVATVEGVPTSSVQIRINETTLEPLLLNAGAPGQDIKVAQDLHITGGGFPKTRWTEGAFIIRAGATQ